MLFRSILAYVVVHVFFFYAAWQLFIVGHFDVLVLLLMVSVVGMLPLFGIEQLGFARAIGLLGVVSFGIIPTMTGKSRRVLLVQGLVLTLLVLVFLAYAWSPEVSDGTNRLMNFTFNYAILMIFVPWRSAEDAVRRFYKVWLLLALMSAVLTILQTEYGSTFWPRYYLRPKEAADRIFEDYFVGTEMYFSGFGFFENRSHNALFQTVALFYALLLLLDGKIRKRHGYPVMILLMVGILLTRSRAGVACALIGFLICILAQPGEIKRGARSHRFAAFAVALLVLCGGAYWFSEELYHPLAIRLETLAGDGFENPLLANERIAMWTYFMADRGIHLSDILEPFGIGFGSSPPDNVYLTVGLEVGLFGLAVFLLIKGLCVVGSYKLYARNRQGSMRAELLVTFLTVTMFTAHFFIGNLYFFEQIYMQVAPFVVYLVLLNGEAKTGSLL